MATGILWVWGDLGTDGFIADIEAIELAFVSQWAHFGQGPAGEFHDEGDRTWLAAPVSELSYNAVIRTRLESDAEARVESGRVEDLRLWPPSVR